MLSAILNWSVVLAEEVKKEKLKEEVKIPKLICNPVDIDLYRTKSCIIV